MHPLIGAKIAEARIEELRRDAAVARLARRRSAASSAPGSAPDASSAWRLTLGLWLVGAGLRLIHGRTPRMGGCRPIA
jgi:hypothetical protein